MRGLVDEGYSIAKLTRWSHFQWRRRAILRMSPCLSAPDRDAAEVRDRREMHQESDAELLKVRATGNECKKELAQEEPEHREDGRNAQIAKWTVVVSIIALVVSIITIVVSVH